MSIDTNAEKTYLEIPPLRIHYKICTPKSDVDTGRTIVLFHPFLSHLETFLLVQQTLADQLNATVISYDRLAFGWTRRDVPKDEASKWYSAEATIQTAVSVIETLKRHPKVTLIGNSAGGTIALGLYRARPELVESICLFAPALIQEGPLALVRWLCTSVPGFTHITRSLYSKLSVPKYMYTGEVDERIAGAYLEASRQDGFVDSLFYFTKYNQPLRVWESAKSGVYRDVKVMIVNGDKDRIVPWKDSEKVVRTINGMGGKAYFKKLEGVGHLIQEERPDEVISVVSDFLKDHV